MKETYLSRDFRETAAQCFPSQAKELNAFFDARLNVLLAENADASKEKQYHLKRQILPGIAAYETLQRAMPKEEALPAAYSHLYLCMDGELAAVICIHDPLRREAREAVKALHESGFTNVVMMTGDNRRTAETVAAEVGVDAVYAEVLPEDKAAFIQQEKAKGHTVIMVGDGVNDSPALSEADAGIAISTGAAIAREIADITVASEDLFALVTLRRLGEALMERIHGSYRFIVGFNLTLIALGVAGVLPPATSALLHNGSTLGISLRNMTDLLDDEENPRK